MNVLRKEFVVGMSRTAKKDRTPKPGAITRNGGVR